VTTRLDAPGEPEQDPGPIDGPSVGGRGRRAVGHGLVPVTGVDEFHMPLRHNVGEWRRASSVTLTVGRKRASMSHRQLHSSPGQALAFATALSSVGELGEYLP